MTIRARWAGSPLQPGDWMLSPNGQAAFRVLSVQPTRVVCSRHDRADIPPATVARPWPDAASGRQPPPSPRMRRRDHLQHLLHRGAITERQFAAAARFRDTLERASPALPVPSYFPRISAAIGGLPVSDGHIRARQATERALAAVAETHIPVLSWILIGNGSVAGYAANARTRETVAADQLRAALGQLAHHYNPPVTGPVR